MEFFDGGVLDGGKDGLNGFQLKFSLRRVDVDAAESEVLCEVDIAFETT